MNSATISSALSLRYSGGSIFSWTFSASFSNASSIQPSMSSRISGFKYLERSGASMPGKVPCSGDGAPLGSCSLSSWKLSTSFLDD